MNDSYYLYYYFTNKFPYEQMLYEQISLRKIFHTIKIPYEQMLYEQMFTDKCLRTNFLKS